MLKRNYSQYPRGVSNLNIHWQMNKKKWHIHTIKYYIPFKKEVLSYNTTWMKFENIMLSELNHAQKNIYSVILLT